MNIAVLLNAILANPAQSIVLAQTALDLLKANPALVEALIAFLKARTEKPQ